MLIHWGVLVAPLPLLSMRTVRSHPKSWKWMVRESWMTTIIHGGKLSSRLALLVIGLQSWLNSFKSTMLYHRRQPFSARVILKKEMRLP